MPANPRSRRSQRPCIEELPEILVERGLSIRKLALQAGVDPGHLNRVLRRANYKTPSAELCAKVARALGLPVDYWPEYRERLVIDCVRSQPRLREELYSRLARKKE